MHDSGVTESENNKSRLEPSTPHIQPWKFECCRHQAALHALKYTRGCIDFGAQACHRPTVAASILQTCRWLPQHRHLLRWNLPKTLWPDLHPLRRSPANISWKWINFKQDFFRATDYTIVTIQTHSRHRKTRTLVMPFRAAIFQPRVPFGASAASFCGSNAPLSLHVPQEDLRRGP